MKKLSYLIILTLILGLVLTGCLLSNVGQVPTTEQSGITYLSKGLFSNLVALWHFDESGGITASDSSGTNDGILTNMSPPDCWVSGTFGNALRFDGSNDRVDCGNDTTLQMVDNLTVEAWVYWTGESVSYDTILARGGHILGGFSVTIRNGTDEIWIFRNGGSVYFDTNLTLTKNEWNHIAVVKYANNDLKVYLNAGTPATTTGFDILTPVLDLPVRIGFWDDYWGGGHRFNGLIDEVRIWDKALDEDDIAYNYYVLRDVPIDIKPGSDPNSINLGSNGVVPVAILGSADFNAPTVNPSTVTLAGAEVKLKGKSGNSGSLEDVNGDGYLDLVVQIYTNQFALETGVTEAVLNAYTYAGLALTGSDSIRIVPPE